MNYLKTLIRYLKWHYSLGFYHISIIYKNVFVFLFEYFAIESLLKEFFLPWKRISGTYSGIKNISSFFSILIQNLIMRFVGIIFRSTVLFVGGLLILISIPFYPVLIFLWAIFPIIIVSLIVLGIILIISIFTSTK
jgi:hypothetical protein